MFNVVFTDEGRALIAEIASDIDYSLLISDVKFSDHDYTGQEATVTEATFTGDFASGTNTISVVDSTTMRIESSFNNRYINEQKDLYTIGIFAKCVKVNGMIYTEIDSGLLAVCTVSTPRIIPPYADAPFSVFSYNINLAVGSADNVTVVETQAGVQYKELTTPLTINGTQETTVEGALGGLNDYGDALADNLAANENVYGAKNLLPYPWYETTKSANGLTFTDNGDGTLTLGTGTASADTYFEFCRRFDYSVFLQNGTYLCTGCPLGVPVGVSIGIMNTDSMNKYIDTGNGIEMPINGTALGNTGSYVGMSVEIQNGTVISTPITFKPMIRDARIVDDTFAPYAKTNQQLTADKAERSDLATLNLTGSTNTTGATINKDTYFYLNGSYCKAKTNIMNGDAFTLDTNYEEVTVGGELESQSRRIDAHVFGTAVTLTGTEYTATADGYLYLYSAIGAGNDCTALVNNKIYVYSSGQADISQHVSLFIKKGMTLKLVSTQGTVTPLFYPMT